MDKYLQNIVIYTISKLYLLRSFEGKLFVHSRIVRDKVFRHLLCPKIWSAEREGTKGHNRKS